MMKIIINNISDSMTRSSRDNWCNKLKSNLLLVHSDLIGLFLFCLFFLSILSKHFFILANTFAAI